MNDEIIMVNENVVDTAEQVIVAGSGLNLKFVAKVGVAALVCGIAAGVVGHIIAKKKAEQKQLEDNIETDDVVCDGEESEIVDIEDE